MSAGFALLSTHAGVDTRIYTKRGVEARRGKRGGRGQDGKGGKGVKGLRSSSSLPLISAAVEHLALEALYALHLRRHGCFVDARGEDDLVEPPLFCRPRRRCLASATAATGSGASHHRRRLDPPPPRRLVVLHGEHLGAQAHARAEAKVLRVVALVLLDVACFGVRGRVCALRRRVMVC